MTGYLTSASNQHRQPSQEARSQVRAAFKPTVLKDMCERPWESFTDFGQRYDLKPSPTGRERYFYWHHNGSKVLGVAHLDSVQQTRRCSVMHTPAGHLVASGALDDRLGVYVILDLLPRLGITCDWLLTTDEEIGQSTAEDFVIENHSYNWMFQFDRGGTDVVMYDYETPDLRKLVTEAGAQVGHGSFSDICLLEHLGCKGFNWGVGYQDYHSPRSHAWIADTFRMVARFEKFYQANAETLLPHQQRPRYHAGTGYLMGGGSRGRFHDSRVSSQWRGKKSEDEEWWSRQELIVADCAHAVDLDDAASYVEMEGLIVCRACGTIPSAI